MEEDFEGLEKQLIEVLTGREGNKHFLHPVIVVCVLSNTGNYGRYKEVFMRYKVPSQVITYANASKFNLSKASNILRQINSKAGGDLYELQFPETFNTRKTMLVGIDVCHAGPNSIVGFSASTNKELSQYYSDHFVQKKNQELLDDKLSALFKAALSVFVSNQGSVPTNVIVFRDGVSEAMREQVLSKEVALMDRVLAEVSGDKKVEITLIVVNKRISQRFFVSNNG